MGRIAKRAPPNQSSVVDRSGRWHGRTARDTTRKMRVPLQRRRGMPTFDAEHINARMAIVDEHIRCENRHDLDAVMATFGHEARYDDEPWDDHRTGLDGVRSYYTELMSALPDLNIEVTQRHVASDSLIVEVIISGTHRGPWRGLPATGRRIAFR